MPRSQITRATDTNSRSVVGLSDTAAQSIVSREPRVRRFTLAGACWLHAHAHTLPGPRCVARLSRARAARTLVSSAQKPRCALHSRLRARGACFGQQQHDGSFHANTRTAAVSMRALIVSSACCCARHRPRTTRSGRNESLWTCSMMWYVKRARWG